jgi:CubicO group peptidase (beta-lactamase class C family)
MAASRTSVARRGAAIALATLLWVASPGLSAASPGGQALQSGIESALADEGLAGAVWALVTADGATVSGAAGLKHAGSAERMTADTRVHVGSVAKVALATGVLRLVSEGRLSLDDPVAEILPSLAFDNPWQATDPIRVRHLLAHTAGLENLRLWQFFSLQAQADTPLAEVFQRDRSVLRVQSRPGSRFRYSNLGYTLLGMVIETVTGDRYEHYLDAHVLQPLAMTDSTFEYTTQTGPRADRRLAMGHFEDGVAQAAVPLYLRPAAQFTTTAADMATLARFLMGDGSVDGRPFVDPRLLQEMTTPSRTEAAEAGLRIGHGLVLAGRDRHGVFAECHPGNTIGFMAMLCLFPREGKAFFVAMNTDSETADYDRFNALLIRSLEIAPPAPMATRETADDIRDWQGFYVPSPFSMRPLAWVDTVLGFTRVRWDGASLQVDPFQSPAMALQPVGGSLFAAPGRTMASHVLLTSADGERVISNGIQNHVRIRTSTLALLWSSLLAGMTGLAYLLVAGIARLLRGRLAPSDALFPPLLAGIALLLPLPFFLSQPVLALGDRTTASLLLAGATGALPLSVIAGLVLRCRRWQNSRRALLDTAALLATLQCLLVLAIWGLLPFRLWH